MKSEAKTREFRGSADWGCPIHGLTVIMRFRKRLDENTGREKSAGWYYACPCYGECKYYVSPGGNGRPARVAVVE